MKNNKEKIIKLVIFVLIVIIIIGIFILWRCIFQIETSKKAMEANEEVLDTENFESRAKVREEEAAKLGVEEESNSINTFEIKSISDQDMARRYFLDYKYYLLYEPEIAYDLLDKNYRETRFESLENFIEYINKNIASIAKGDMNKYEVEQQNSLGKYKCVDKDNNYYTFYETSPMQYTVKLGKYEIDSEKFLEEYQGSISESKVMLNINKFLMMISNKEYDRAYKVLDDTFRDNFFKTEEEFTKYVKEEFFIDNDVEYQGINKKEDSIYTAEAIVKNNINKDEETRKKTFEVILLEGTDFTLSFDVEQKDNQ